MEIINLTIKNVKNILSADIEIPYEDGLYALVGNNGCGKSTIMLLLAQLLSTSWWAPLRKEDCDPSTSLVILSCMGKTDIWRYSSRQSRWLCNHTMATRIHIPGTFEGSLFYGTRFNDSRIVDDLFERGVLNIADIVPADDYVSRKLSFILHGDENHYQSLKRVKNRDAAKKLGVRNTPYFLEVKGNLISQYRMSSGECMLVSLLHFLYNSIVRGSVPEGEKVLVLIDEIELALHPIAVSRLIDFLHELLAMRNNLTILLTSHSPEVIRKIKPSNLYKVINQEGILSVQSNCYPSYLIRDVYSHDGFDYLLLVEDGLAKCVVDKIVLKNNLGQRKLIHVVPVGGWENVLALHQELLQYNILGVGKKIISILDGDIKEDALTRERYKSLPKLFLPVGSVEKFIYSSVIEKPNKSIVDTLNDKYFVLKSLNALVQEHREKYPCDSAIQNPDKKFYFRLKKDLESRSISEEYFITNLCDDLMAIVDFSSFTSAFCRMLECSHT